MSAEGSALGLVKVRIVAPTLHWLGFRSGLSSWLASRQQAFRILMFHGVDDLEYRTDAFEQQLLFLRRHFSVVPIQTIVEHLEARTSASRREVALTFDDGLRNNATIVYPILERLGVPATFFVCPGLMDRGNWQWPYEVRSRIGRLSGSERREFASAIGAPDPEPDALEEWMKDRHLDRRCAVEAALRARTPHFAASPEERVAFDTMSWDELRGLDPGLITVGSHTLTHPILTRLDPQDVWAEVVESKRVLEDRLGRPVEYFCYPDGAYDSGVVDCVRAHYRAAVTTDEHFVAPSHDLHLLGRIPAASATPLLAWRMHRPGA